MRLKLQIIKVLLIKRMKVGVSCVYFAKNIGSFPHVRRDGLTDTSLSSHNTLISIHQLCLYVIHYICVGHNLIAISWIMQLLAYGRIVEEQHSSLGRDLEFLGKLHYNASYLSIKNVIFHNSTDSINVRYLSIIS